MSESWVFNRGGIEIPGSSYLVFVLPDGTVKVVKSEFISYLEGDTSKFTLADEIHPEKCDVDIDRFELSVENTLVNNVRWFDAEKTKEEGTLKISSRKYSSRLGPIHYLVSLFTLGIGGCLLLRSKNLELGRVAVNWDKTQKDLCEHCGWGELGKQVHQLFGSSSIDVLNRAKQKSDELDRLGSEEDLQIIRKLHYAYGAWDRLYEDLDGLKQYGNFESIKSNIELGQKVSQILGVRDAAQAQSFKDSYELALRSAKSPGNDVPAQPLPQNNYVDPKLVERLTEGYNGDLSSLVFDVENMRRQYGSFRDIEDHLRDWKEVKRLFNVETLDGFRNFETEYRKIENELGHVKKQNLELQDYQTRFRELQNSIQSLASSDEEKNIIRGFRDRVGGLAQLREDVEGLKRYGTFEDIRQKLEFANEVSRKLGIDDADGLVRFKSSYDEVKSCGDPESISRSLDENRKLTFQNKLLEEKLEEQKKINAELNKYKGEWEEMQRELNDFGSEEERKILKKTYYLFDIKDEDAFQAAKNKWDSIPVLEKQLDEFSQINERWKSLSDGRDLEALEKLKIEHLQGGKSDQGISFEHKLMPTLEEIRKHCPHQFNYEYQPKLKGSKKIPDFKISIRDSHQRYFKICVECKWSGEYYEQTKFLRENKDSHAWKDQFTAGVKDLCEYYDKEKFNFGLLVMNWGVKEPQVIRNDQLPSQYSNKDINLLLIQPDSLEYVLQIIRCVLDSKEPVVELSAEYESLQHVYKDPEIRTFVKKTLAILHDFKENYRFLTDRLEDASTHIKNAKSYSEKINKTISMLKENAHKLDSNLNWYGGLALEGTTTDAVISEEEETKVLEIKEDED